MKDKIKVILYPCNLDYIVDEFQTRDPVKLLAASLLYTEELTKHTAYHKEYLRICAALDSGDPVQVLESFIEDYTKQLTGEYPIWNNQSTHAKSCSYCPRRRNRPYPPKMYPCFERQ